MDSNDCGWGLRTPDRLPKGRVFPGGDQGTARLEALRRIDIFGSMIEFEEVAPGVFSVAHDFVEGKNAVSSANEPHSPSTAKYAWPLDNAARGLIEAC